MADYGRYIRGRCDLHRFVRERQTTSGVCVLGGRGAALRRRRFLVLVAAAFALLTTRDTELRGVLELAGLVHHDLQPIMCLLIRDVGRWCPRVLSGIRNRVNDTSVGLDIRRWALEEQDRNVTFGSFLEMRLV